MRITTVFVWITLFQWSLPAQDSAPIDDPSLRSSLSREQLATRQMALLHKQLRRNQVEPFSSLSHETSSKAALQAAIAYEKFVQALLENQLSIAFAELEKAMGFFSTIASSDKPGVRSLLMAKEVVTEGDSTDPKERLFQLAEALLPHSLPSREVLLHHQYEAEHWVQSAALILKALDTLKNAPRNLSVQSDIIQETARSICHERILIQQLMEKADSSIRQHEVLLDHIVFAARRTAFYDRVSACLEREIQSLPPTVQPAGYALYSLWSGNSPHKTPKSPFWNPHGLSSVEADDYLLFASIILAEADNPLISSFRDQISLNIPDVVLLLGQVSPTSVKVAGYVANCSASSELYQFFDQAIATHSSQYPQLYTAKLKALVLSKNWDQALSFSDKVSQSTSTLEPEFYYWQAEAQLKATRPNDALVNFVRFVELQPNSRLAPLALFMTGLVSLNLQKKVEAKQYFQQTIQNYPNSPEATRAKAFLAAL